MIDPENEVYTRVANALAAEYPNADISGTYKKSPAAFPHVFCEMVDNQVTSGSQTSSGREECVDVTFTFNIYSNRKTGPKAEAKRIAEIIAGIMFSMNFRRTSQMPVPNADDNASIYRIVAQYVGRTDGKNFYRR